MARRHAAAKTAGGAWAPWRRHGTPHAVGAGRTWTWIETFLMDLSTAESKSNSSSARRRPQQLCSEKEWSTGPRSGGAPWGALAAAPEAPGAPLGPTPKEMWKVGASIRPRCSTRRNEPIFEHSSRTFAALLRTPLASMIRSPGNTFSVGFAEFHRSTRPPVIDFTLHGSPSWDAKSTPKREPSGLSITMMYSSPSAMASSVAGSGSLASHFSSMRPRPLAMRKPVPPRLFRVVAE
mmetsp:Transcript_30998/g.90370  ORF Transcript_30998/g.90370 Transcript_30998/m.90370 type:complete len:236 (-) Transcript_30998:1270-1977(-)